MLRRRLIAPVFALALGGVAVAGAAPASALTQTFQARLNGGNEVPGPGSPTATGIARVTVDGRTGNICYVIRVYGLDSPTAAHIHDGGRRVAGPVVVTLDPPVDGRSEGCVTDKAEAREILADPTSYYVNVHNAEFPAGAIRGQLS